MSALIPCTRHDRPGADDPLLREILADASHRAGRDLGGELVALYDYAGQLLASWRDAAARAASSNALGAAWRSRMGDASLLHLVPSEEDYDYQEDVVDNGADT